MLPDPAFRKVLTSDGDAESLCDAVLSLSDDVIFLTDASGHVCYQNAAAAQWLRQFSVPDDSSGRQMLPGDVVRFISVVPDSDVLASDAPIRSQSALMTGETTLRGTVTRRKWSSADLQFSGIVSRIQFQNHQAAVSVSGTEQTRETGLAKEAVNELMSQAEEIAHPGSFDWDLQTGRLTWSEELYRIYGYTPGELEVSPEFFISHVLPEDQEKVQQTIQTAIQTLQPFRMEERIRRRDGEVRILESQGKILRNQEGQPERVIGACLDVTERKAAEETLRASEERIRSLIAAVAEGSVFQSTDGTIHECNESAERILGLTRDQMCGRTSMDPRWRAIHEDGSPFPGHEHPAMETIRTGKSVSNVIMGVHKPDGTLTWISINSEPMIGPGNIGIYGVVCSFADITEKYRAESELRKTADLLHAVTNGTTDAVFVKDRHGRYLMFNDAACQFVGRTIQQVIGFDDNDLFSPESAAFLMDRDQRIMRTEQVETEEETLTANGITRTYLATKGPYRNEKGEVIGVIGISRDITDRKRAEEERDRLWNNAPDPVCVVDFEGQFIQVNPAWSRVLGWSESETFSFRWQELIHADDLESATSAARRVKAGETVKSYETRWRCRDGSYRTLSWSSIPEAEVGRIYAFARDVTNEKLLGEQFRQSQKLEAVGRLAGGVAHDFNNLLTVINGHTELLLGSMAGSDRRRDQLMAIRDAGERAATLTSQLLALSRKAVIAPRVLDLNVVVDSAASLLRRLIGEHFMLNVLMTDRPALILADQSQVEQVIMNLVVNARDAMPSGGRILLQIEHVDAALIRSLEFETTNREADGISATGSCVALTVADSGHGMTDDVKSRIFEPFFTTKGVGKGTGLGLAVVHGVTQQFGGRISVESRLNAGTRFVIYFPECTDISRQPERGQLRRSVSGSETILLVEDDEAVRRITRMALESQGFHVLEASGAAMALRILADYTSDVHLLITDIVMPDMGGRQLVEEVRRHRPYQRVLYISGHTDDEIVRREMTNATESFLQKPFTALGLARKVRSVLDAAGGG
ncbi:MAG: PAS domain S-box protein [Planctomyces sp.]